MNVKIGSTHVYLSGGRRALIVDDYGDGTYAVQQLFFDDNADKIERVSPSQFTVAEDEYIHANMPLKNPASVTAQKGKVWTTVKKIMTLGLVK